MFYNDDFFKRTKTIVRYCLDIVVRLMLILKRNFILHVLNVVKCTLKSGTRTQSYKQGG